MATTGNVKLISIYRRWFKIIMTVWLLKGVYVCVDSFVDLSKTTNH